MRTRRTTLALAALAATAAALLLMAPATADARRLNGPAPATTPKPAADTTPTPAADDSPGFPRTRSVYVEVKVAHTAAHMALEGRADKLARLVKEAALGVRADQRMAVAAVEATPAGSDGRPASMTYGAVLFNDEAGEAEREVAAAAAPGALERVAASAKAFGVAVTDLAARFGTRRRRRNMMMVAASTR